jgi:NADPH2:quinone reductase
VKPPFPFILGAEFAGKVAQGSPIPKGCPYKSGDRVFGSAQGCFADKVSIKWQSVIPLPDSLTFDQGAGTCGRELRSRSSEFLYVLGLYLTWPTSYEALVGRAELKPGESSHYAYLTY